MPAKLIGYTQVNPDVFADPPQDLQEFIALCARVSNPANQMNHETSERLNKYLIKHKHWSPFEMVNAVLEIKTTRDISRQLLRHRSFSFQEFSQRYAEVDATSFTVFEARLQDPKNRQNSVSTDDKTLQKSWEKLQEDLAVASFDDYYKALDLGIAKELARKLLPEGLTPTTLYMNGTMRSWIHFIEARSYEGAQKEIRDLTQEIFNAILPVFPMLGLLNAESE